MSRALTTVATVIAAFIFTGQSADAQWRKQHVDKRVAVVSLGVGAASTATYLSVNEWNADHWNATAITQFGAFAGTTIGCMAVAPMLATLVVDRPLTIREAQVLFASCLIPVIGAWLVNQAYDAHPEWEAGEAPPPPAPHHKKRYAKM